ncbi:MAG: hypothetical protein ACR2NU_16410 [Aeoliella sp.]
MAWKRQGGKKRSMAVALWIMGTVCFLPLLGCGNKPPEPKTVEEIEKARVEHGNQVLKEAQSSGD